MNTIPPTIVPTIIFDLNYASSMSPSETKALASQLTKSYASNRRSTTPFKLVFSGAGFLDSPLRAQLAKQDFDRWSNVTVEDSSEPWRCRSEPIIYLTADSDSVLSDLSPSSVFIIGGLVDHVEKPNFSLARATRNDVATARLPLLSAVKITTHNKEKNNTEHVDVSTLAVVQLLHSFYAFREWPLAIYNCPSFHSAPLRKFIHWKPPYDFLNDVENGGRPYRLGEGFNLTAGGFRPPTKEDINDIKKKRIE